MITSWLGFSPVIASQVLVIFCACSMVIFVLSDRCVRSLLRSHWKSIGLLIVLVVAWRYPFQDQAFYGLEYEDSYVYAVSARTTLSQDELRESAYLTSTCVIGSLKSCEGTETFSGHFIGWPSIIRLATHVINFYPLLPIYLNIAGSAVACVAIFLICQIMGSGVQAGVAAAIIFATTPAFAVHGVATYAEPMSNSLIASVLLCYMRFLDVHDADRSRKSLTANWIACVFVGLLAVLVKRENLLLGIAIFLAAVFLLARRNGSHPSGRARLWLAAFAGILVIAIASSELAPVSTLVSESREFGMIPFSVSNLRALVPSYLRAFVSLEWYSCSFLFVLTGLCVSVRRFSTAFIALLFVCYFLLYASHVESYYQIHSGSVLPGQTLRFSMNLMTLWSVLGGLGVVAISRQIMYARARKVAIPLLTVIYLAACFAGTMRLRRDAHVDEVNTRIRAAVVAGELARSSNSTPTYIVTLEPLVIQMFNSEETRVVGLYAIDESLLRRLRKERTALKLLSVGQSQYANTIANERYEGAIQCLSTLPRQTVFASPDFSVYSIMIPGVGEDARSAVSCR